MLERKLEHLARVPVLLIASDYDGTLAPIVQDPREARPLREASVALRCLSTSPQTHVAVISGRALRDLAELLVAPPEVHLVGSHGSEFDLDFAQSLEEDTAHLRDRVLRELREIADASPGFHLETKPASIAFHYRNASQEEAVRALELVERGPGGLKGVYTRHGKKVVELGVVETSKGRALEVIRQRVGASAVLFFGDDLTDEEAFATLSGPDVGIKVGPGDTSAEFRVEGPADVARILVKICELRNHWAAGAGAVPIERHAMLSDQRTIAIVTPDARVTWLCLPRIDSPSLFSELLGGPADGHFSIRAADGSPPIDQRYVDGTMVLQTRWPTFTVTDFLDCSRGRPVNRAGRSELVRIVEGSGRVAIEFVPRLDFGRVPTRFIVRDGGLEVGEATDPIVLRAPGVTWEILAEGSHESARTIVELSERPLVLELRHGTASLRGETQDIPASLNMTQRYWTAWADQLALPSVEPEMVRRSAIILKALCYGPTGAICAAGTTSLPEHLGGVRNWDYRYCWLRDAAMTATALAKLGTMAEGMHFLDWMAGVIDRCQSPERLHPLYSVNGDELGPEAEIGQLSGYAGSRPVRVGNSAARQVQLDVFGPIVNLVAVLVEHDAPLSWSHWRLVEAMVQAVQRRWREPDHGIWEVRVPRRHHVHSKVMCWLTVDRAIEIARRMMDRERADWLALRDEIAADVLTNGFKASIGAFTAAYEGEDMDAAALHIGLCGMLPHDDQRMMQTIDAIEKALLEGPTVYRYRTDDGLPGKEGGFFICASWLVDTYLRLGRTDDAWKLFNAMLDLAGPTGLFAEQYDPELCRSLGNFPQAYSHLGIIENALSLSAL
ncbi:MAG TPA: trehalose-phosphatase [Phycisphaerae bacterium]|nr:trehalose-phosphatase [Phycisphaerae bacterium]